MGKPKVGIFGLTGCAGDQLVILNCEDQLLQLVDSIDIRDFLMASSAVDSECLLDIAFVEGAVLSTRDERRLKRIRERCGLLVAIGTCAVWGGIAAMDRGRDREELLRDIYGEMARMYDTQPARALGEVVKVDVNISGCPIEKEQFLSGVSNLLNSDPPVFPEYPVCTECKLRENECLLLDRSAECCGPLTVAGCRARCPELGVPCVGCRGPCDNINVKSAIAMFEEKGVSLEQIAYKLRTFAPTPVEARAESRTSNHEK